MMGIYSRAPASESPSTLRLLLPGLAVPAVATVLPAPLSLRRPAARLIASRLGKTGCIDDEPLGTGASLNECASKVPGDEVKKEDDGICASRSLLL